MSDLLAPFQVPGPAPAATAPIVAPPVAEPVKKIKSLDPFTALKAQDSYKAPIDQNAKSLPPAKGGTADTLGTGGAWGTPQ